VTGVHRYRHYGLTIEANVVLPGLPTAEAGPTDVQVQIVRASERPQVESSWTMIDPLEGAWRSPGTAGSSLRLQFEGPSGSWAVFVIEERGEIVHVTLGESSDLDDACELLIASIFSCVLAQRGLTCLHASVVAIADRVIALVGAKAAGKSTLALALAQRGGQLLSDDVAAVSWREGVCGVAVGRPALRMRPDSAASLGAGATELRSVWGSAAPHLAKRYYRAGENPRLPTPSWLPLAAVFLLAPRGGTITAHARPVPPGELLPTLLANRHMALVLDQAGHRRDFACLAALVRHLPGRELRRPDDLETVSAAAAAVAVDVGNITDPGGGPSQPSCDDVL
jgi:hypothetical protein